jgi:hypothetical protein
MAFIKKEKIMHKIAFISLVLTCSFSLKAQRETYINPGLISASTTLSPSQMLNKNQMNFYVTGFLEGRIHKRISLRGELHYMLGNNTDKFLRNNIRSTFGIQYGIPVGNFEAHAGFAPGFSVMQSYHDPSNTEFVPSIQLNIGVRYYVWKVFHFFCNFSYIHARMNNLSKINGMADELMFSAGLGFNFQVLKKYRNPSK